MNERTDNDDHRSAQLVEYRFGTWSYQPALRLLQQLEAQDGESLPAEGRRLKPLLNRLLLRLLSEPGVVISREQLLEQVWTRRQVNDEVLSRAVAELRSELADDAREPRFIETLSKGGYRWVAELSIGTASNAPLLSVEPLETTSQPRLDKKTWPAITTLVLICLIAIAWWTLRPTTAPTQASEPAIDLLSARPLTADPRLEHDPRFDAQGHIVYVRTDAEKGGSELIVVDRTGLGDRSLWQTDGYLRRPAPSPDGSTVAVQRWQQRQCTVWSVAALDGRSSRLTDCGSDETSGMEWVDDDELLFSAPAIEAGQPSGLAILNLTDGSVRRLTQPSPEDGPHINPRLSTDARTLVYASSRVGDQQLWSTDWPAMAQREALLVRPEPVYGHAFDPDGQTLWVAGDLSLYRALHRIQPGRKPELLGGRGALSVDLAKDGAVVWSEAIYDGEIWVRGAADADWQTAGSSVRYESQPEFSPDGDYLALASNRGGSESIFIVDLRNGEARALRLNPSHRWVRPTWAPDGRSLILTAYEAEHTRLYRYQLDDDALVDLVETGQDAFHGVQVDERLLYRSGRHDLGHLMQWRPPSPPEDLGIGEIAGFRANARWLVWHRPGSTTLYAAALDQLADSRAVAEFDQRVGEPFNLFADDLVYAENGKLWRLRLPDGEPSEVPSAYYPSSQGPSLAVGANGALAVSKLESLSMDLMLATPAHRP